VIFGFDEFEFDAERLELRREGKAVRADPMVLRLLRPLVRNAGQLVTKQQLIDEVWDGRAMAANVITVTMLRLRKLLGHDPERHEVITNVYGRGYSFVLRVQARAQQAPAPPAISVAGEAPFVGRERLMSALRAALAEARAGRGRVCVLSGEAGIGKTRAVEVLEREAREAGVRVAWGHCYESGHTPPLWPFGQLVRAAVTGVSPDALRSRLNSSLPDLARLLPEWAQSGSAQKDAFDDDPASQHRMFDAITRALTSTAERAPCLLVLDDLHRADAASLELLRYLAPLLAHAPILLVATMRNDDGARVARSNPSLGYVLGHRNCERLALPRLGAADVASYVDALLDDPDGRLASAVFVKSEGNPFFMVELTRQLRDAPNPDPELLGVPALALELVRQRVSALDEATRGLLSYAAVIGRSFELKLLQAVVAPAETERIVASLDAALAGEVLVAVADSKTLFAFGHELLRTVLYDALAPAERRRLHLRVAEALEQRAEGGAVVPPAELAYHFRAALPEGDPRKVVQHSATAAEAAARVFAYTDTVRYLRHALQALDQLEHASPRMRLRLLLGKALAVRFVSSREFERDLAEAIALARAQGVGDQLARAALMLDLHPGFHPLPGAREALEDALGLLPAEERATRAAVLARLAMTAPYAYSGERSSALIDEALALARETGVLRTLHTALGVKAHLTGGPAQRALSERTLLEYEQLCQQHPRTLSVPPVLIDLQRAIVALQDGDLGAMDAALARCEARCRKLNYAELLFHAERFRTLAAIHREGTSAAHVDALQALHARAEQHEILGAELLCAYDRCVVLGELAGLPVPIAAVRDKLAFDAGDAPNLWSLKLRALSAAGLSAEARAGLLAVPAERLALLPCDRDYLGTLGHLVRVALAVDAPEYLCALRPLLAPYPDRLAVHVSFVSQGPVSELLQAIDARAGAHSGSMR
jgi:DNA-binding winged helix-turn-helix (wHTH) protein